MDTGKLKSILPHLFLPHLTGGIRCCCFRPGNRRRLRHPSLLFLHSSPGTTAGSSPRGEAPDPWLFFGSPLFFNPSSNPLIAWKESFFSREGTRLFLSLGFSNDSNNVRMFLQWEIQYSVYALISSFVSARYLSLRVGNENSMWKHFLSQEGKGKRVHSPLTKFRFLCLSKTQLFLLS